MALGGRELRVILTSDVDKFRRGLRTAETDARGFSKRIGKAVAVGLAAAAAAAATFAAKFATDGVQAFIDDEAASKKLARTLKNLGKEQDTAKVEAYVDQLSKATGVADDDLRPALEKLVGATGDTDQAMRLLAAAVDTSAGSGKDLAGTADAIAKAVGPKGTLGALKRLFPGLDTTKTKAGDAESVLKVLNQRFAGQAAARMDTYSGKVAAVATAYSELQESFGRGLLSDQQGLADGMDGLDDTLYSLGPAMENFGRNVGIAAAGLAQIVEYATKLDALGPDWLPPDWFSGGTLSRIPQIGEGARYLTGLITGNDAAAQAALDDFKGKPHRNVNPNVTGDPNRPANTYFDPVRYMTQQRHNQDRADARSAQRAARTNTRP